MRTQEHTQALKNDHTGERAKNEMSDSLDATFLHTADKNTKGCRARSRNVQLALKFVKFRAQPPRRTLGAVNLSLSDLGRGEERFSGKKRGGEEEH